MKKLLGISLVAVLAATPLMAKAAVGDVAPSPIAAGESGLASDGTNVVTAASGKYYAGKTITDADKAATASAAYVKGAYNAAISAVNKVAVTADGAVQDVVEGTTNGTIKVDNVDVAVHGLGSAAYTDSTAYDAAGAAAAAETAAKAYADGLASNYESAGAITTAIEALDANKSQTAGADGLALSITEVDGKITAISGSIAAGTYDAYGDAAAAETAAKAYADGLASNYDAAGSAASAQTAAVTAAKNYTDSLQYTTTLTNTSVSGNVPMMIEWGATSAGSVGLANGSLTTTVTTTAAAPAQQS